MKTRLQLAHLPPSVNHIYRHTRRGTFRTEAYRAWANAEGWTLCRQIANQPKWATPVYITAALRRPRANADLDNRLKGIGDLLQELGVIANDKLISGWNVFWSSDLPKEVAAEISITAADMAGEAA